MSRAPDNWQTAYIGLGGNVGDVLSNMCSALSSLHVKASTKVNAVSHLYRTPPWGVEDQDWFLNACAELQTLLSPKGLLEECLDVERELKRVRRKRWGPRTIDIDVLTFGDQTVDLEGLQIPHPRLTERAFVLLPLADIAPDLLVRELTVSQWLENSDLQGIERLPGGDGWWTPPDQ